MHVVLKRLKIAEPKNNMSKHETSRDKIACTECILVCFMHNTTKIALMHNYLKPRSLHMITPKVIPTAVLTVLNPIL